MLRNLLLLLLLLTPAAASAEWRQATSANFVVSSEGDEGQLRELTAKLEKLHFALRAIHGITAPPSPIPLKVFLMKDMVAVQRTLPYPADGVAGYYEASARGPLFVGTRARSKGKDALNSEAVLLHEFAHHFMYQYFPATYPTWYSEGFAEFYGSTQIGDDDVIVVGLPANHRFSSFDSNRWLPIRRLLTAQSYADAGNDVDLLYAQGWLLVHYLFSNPERSGQMAAYLNAINAGKSYEEAMNLAFGEGGKKLNNELFNYAGRTQLGGIRLPFKKIDVGPIAVRKLTPAEDALVLQEIQLGQGLLARNAASFAEQVRKIAARYPDDPYTLLVLVEAERAAGNGAAALAAADRLLALEPDHPRGLMHKAMLQHEGGAPARALLSRALKAAPKDPLILEAWYDSYGPEGKVPPAAAQNALYRALELAPGDSDLRYKLAADFEARGMFREAMIMIQPSALRQPHRGDESEREKARREKLEDQWRLAGQTRRETAREMWLRLQEKVNGKAPPAAPAKAGT